VSAGQPLEQGASWQSRQRSASAIACGRSSPLRICLKFFAEFKAALLIERRVSEFKKMARRIWFDADDYSGEVISIETYAFPLLKSISCQAMEWLDLRPGWIQIRQRNRDPRERAPGN